MDRQIVYSGSIPLETDLLNTNRNTMVALGKLVGSLFGSQTIVNGLAVVPTTPASLSVNVAPGEIYTVANLDSSAYSSLSADTSHQVMKQGIALDATALALSAPATSGQTINYLVQATYQDLDTGATVLPYYSSSNPTQAWAGPANAGTPQYTQRKGTIVINAKAGTAATTGSQLTPAPDSGYVGLYVVTVSNGQSSISASNIVQYSQAPILPNGVFQAMLKGNLQYGIDRGSANAVIASFSFPTVSLVDGQSFLVKIQATNTGATTFTPNSGVIAALPVIGGAGLALQGGELVAGGYALLIYRLAINSFELRACSGGALQIAGGTASNHAVNLGQLNTALSNAVFTNSQGSIGIGTTPKVWGAQYPVVQLNQKTSIAADANSTYYDINRYSDAATSSDFRLGSGYALRYQQDAALGYHKWQSATSSSAASAISWSTVMQVDPSGVLTVPGGIASIPACRGAHSNLSISYAGTSGAVTVTANELVIANSSNVYITLRNLSLSATSGSVSGAANGLDTGSWAYSTWYFLYVIYNPTTSTSALLWSISSSLPTLPIGYTHYARVGANKTQSATNYWFLSGVQRDRVFQYLISSGGNVAGVPLMANGSAGSTTTPTYVAISLSSFIPLTASSIRFFAMQTGSGATIMVAPNTAYGPYASSSNPPPVYLVQPSVGGTSIAPMTLLLESMSIYWISSASSNYLYCFGWEDNL